MSCQLEKRLHDGDHPYRTPPVLLPDIEIIFILLTVLARYMALPQHKKLPQPPEGLNF